MKFCTRCILPTTRPQLEIEGEFICNACRGSLEKREVINWEQREEELRELLNQHRRQNPRAYDCVIPVSGGKDSTWQVYTIKYKYGLKPLTFSWKPRNRTKLGWKNLENLQELGVDHIDFTVNPVVERRFMLKALRISGSPSLPEHMAMFSLSLNTAIQQRVPLVIWGENPGLEYGGSRKFRESPIMDREWFQKYGVTNGTFAEDWADEELPLNEMTAYRFPDDTSLSEHQIIPIFLGWFLPWDPIRVASDAQGLGFVSAKRPVLGYYPFSDLDAPFIVIHHFMKWFKFGFTRLWDNLALEIRYGRMSRDEAINYIRTNPEPLPQSQIKSLCQYLSLREDDFWKIVETHRNLQIWDKDAKGRWTLPGMIEEFGFMPQNYTQN